MERESRSRVFRTSAVLIFAFLAVALTLVAVPNLRRDRAVVGDLIERILSGVEEEQDHARAVAQLARLGEEGLDAMAEALTAGSLDGEPLGETRREVLTRGLEAYGPPALDRFFHRWLEDSATEPRVAFALVHLGAVAEAAQVTRLVVIAGLVEPTPRVRRELETALAGTLRRDGRAFASLPTAWRRADERLRPVLLAAVSATKDPRALPFLAELLGTSDNLDDDVLRRMGDLAPLAIPPSPESVTWPVRRLLELGSASQVQAAALVLGHLQDEPSIPTLIAHLESDSRGIRSQAARALARITDLGFREDRDRWASWYAEESRWFDEEWSQTLSDLRSGDLGRVLTGIRTVGRHRLYRHDTARNLLPLLDDPSPSVRASAAQALASLASPVAIGPLAGLLRDEDRTVAESAWSALTTLTGRNEPIESPTWAELAAKD